MHRGTTLNKLRAPHIAQPLLLGRQRRTQSLQRTKSWLDQRGVKGRLVLEYEWQNHKRVLQFHTLKRHQFRGKRMRDGPFYAQV